MSNPKIYIGKTLDDGSCFYSSIYRFLLYHNKLDDTYIKNNFRFLNLDKDQQYDPYNFDKSKSINAINKQSIKIDNINFDIYEVNHTIKINNTKETEFMEKLRKFLIRYIDKDPYSKVETYFNSLKNIKISDNETYKQSINDFSIEHKRKLETFNFDTLDNFKQILKDAFTIITCNVSQIDKEIIFQIFKKLFFLKIVLIQNGITNINIFNDKDTIYLYFDGVGHYQFILTDI